MTEALQYELSDVPSDGISSVRFSPRDPHFLLSSSWDASLRLHNVEQNSVHIKFSNSSALLDCSFGQDSYIAFSGSLEGKVTMYDMVKEQETLLGEQHGHQDAVRCVNYASASKMLVSGSWDKSLRVWDLRGKSPSIIYLRDKVYSMDVSDYNIIVGMASRAIDIYDLRYLPKPIQQRESSMQYQIRCIRGFPNGEGFATASIEGRVAVELYDPSPESTSKMYAFKCHRENLDGTETVYPVNSLAFHPVYSTFATGGCDGQVFLWDGFSKKRLKNVGRFPTSISSMAFNTTGQLLAIASSYTYELGEKDHPPDSIFIRSIQDADVKPKTSTVSLTQLPSMAA